MHGLNGGYTGYFNRKYGRVGHLFQGRYRAIVVDKEAYLIPLSRYVHLNPVRGGVVGRPEEYRWSSYPGYIGKRKQYGWVEYSWILSQFGHERVRAKKKYKEYVEEALKGDVGTPLKSILGQVILGGEAFINKIKKMLQGEVLSDDILERKRLLEHPSLDKVVGVVARAFGVRKEVIQSKGGRVNIARKVALYFVQRYTGLNNQAIGRLFGGIHRSTVSKASARLKEEMVSNNRLLRFVHDLDSHFKA